MGRMIPCMRRKVTVETLRRFMQELAGAARSPGNVYLTGGATALLLGFRQQTIDIDIKLDPEPAGVFEAIAALKNQLHVNVELASPNYLIPANRRWRETSRYVASIGQLQFYHYDFTLQVLAKLERGHAQDLEDVANLIRGGFTTAPDVESALAEIEPGLLRYPAIDPMQFRKKV